MLWKHLAALRGCPIDQQMVLKGGSSVKPRHRRLPAQSGNTDTTEGTRRPISTMIRTVLGHGRSPSRTDRLTCRVNRSQRWALQQWWVRSCVTFLKKMIAP